MLFIFAISTLISAVSASSCQTLCSSLDECANDPHAHGSYCKTWNEPNVCFGLYYTDETRTSLCFQPNNSACPERFPVECPAPVAPRCEEICQSVETCRNDPHAHGSYCKTWQTPNVCFGLYHTESGICFQPNDPSCKESTPVLC